MTDRGEWLLRLFGADGKPSPSRELVRRFCTLLPPVVGVFVIADDLFEYAIAASSAFAAVLSALPFSRARALLGALASLFILSAVAMGVDINTQYGLPGPSAMKWLIILVSFGALLLVSFVDLHEANEVETPRATERNHPLGHGASQHPPGPTG
jgi:hypothetical protein